MPLVSPVLAAVTCGATRKKTHPSWMKLCTDSVPLQKRHVGTRCPIEDTFIERQNALIPIQEHRQKIGRFYGLPLAYLHRSTPCLYPPVWLG